MEAKIAAKEPMEAELEAGKTYFWCACGHSKTQPFCDGTHKEVNATITEPAHRFKPVRLSVENPQKAWLCMCKHTKTPPYCDGTHKTL
jgi:CDGSH-type Zn-finger protein